MMRPNYSFASSLKSHLDVALLKDLSAISLAEVCAHTPNFFPAKTFSHIFVSCPATKHEYLTMNISFKRIAILAIWVTAGKFLCRQIKGLIAVLTLLFM